MSPLSQFIALGVVTGISFIIAIIHGRGSVARYWSTYVLMIGIPVAAALSLSLAYGTQVFWLFLCSGAVGFVLEFVLGFSYKRAFGERLWTYNRFQVAGHTSLITPPIWGLAGIVFWLLGRTVGL